MSRDLSKAIIGIFVGTIFGLFMALTYWGHAAYQIILSIIGGSLLVYFCVAPRQAWQQVKLAGKKAVSDWPKNSKKMINEAIRVWKKTPYHTKRLVFLSLSLFILFTLLTIQPRILSPVYMGLFTIFMIAHTYFSGIIFIVGTDLNIFNRLFKNKIVSGQKKVNQLLTRGKKMEVYNNGRRALLCDAPWWYYESRMLLITSYIIFVVFATIFLWMVLSIVLVFVTIARFLFWLPVILSTQDLFLKIFTGTAFSVMAGVYYYQSYAVGLAAAGVFSLVLIIFKRFGWQEFKVFAFLGKDSKLRLAFAKANLFSEKK